MGCDQRAREVGHEDYSNYLRSEQWIDFRKRYFEKYKRSCFVCKTGRNIHLHHITYERLGRELLQDVTPLCDSCHYQGHRLVKEGKCNLENVHFYMKKHKKKYGEKQYVTNWRKLLNKSKKQTLTELQKFLERHGLLNNVKPTKKAFQEGYVKILDEKPKWNRKKYIALIQRCKKRMKRVKKAQALTTPSPEPTNM